MARTSDTGSAARDVQLAVAKAGVLPAGVSFEMGGLFAEQQAAFRGMALVFAACLIVGRLTRRRSA